MKQIIKSAAYILIICLVSFASCKKEINETSLLPNKKWPVANSGPDQVITLPTDSVTLDGSASTDDKKISSYQWSKISGPVSLNIVNASAAKTVVNNLVQGVYRFELKVTDDGRLSANDTVMINVEPTGTPNRLPVSNAGVDQTINWPNNTVILDGINSTDPDGTVTSYAWTKIDGPNQYTIVNAAAVSTAVNNLLAGIYSFRLLVTDNNGATDDDTMMVTVNPPPPLTNVQLIPFATLSQERYDVAIATAGNKLVIAGGIISDEFSSAISTRVDLYDMSTHTWSTAELSQARINIVATAIGNKIFFAGGIIYSGLDGSLVVSSRVDIYDALTNTWSTAELSEARAHFASAAIGNKILFAGGLTNSGNVTSSVDIYDVTLNSWTTASLSEARTVQSALTAGNKIYFAGGGSNKIDIYDVTTNSWSTDTLLQAKSGMAGIAVDNKLYWAGGVTANLPYLPSREVEIYDINTQTRSYAELYQARLDFSAALKDNKILFFISKYRIANDPQLYADIYELNNNKWSIAPIDNSFMGSVMISAGNNIYVTRGGNVWICQL